MAFPSHITLVSLDLACHPPHKGILESQETPDSQETILRVLKSQETLRQSRDYLKRSCQKLTLFHSLDFHEEMKWFQGENINIRFRKAGSNPILLPRRSMTLDQGFSVLVLLTFQAGLFFVMEAVLYTVECSAASLALHIIITVHPKCDNQSVSLDINKCLGGGWSKSSPDENYSCRQIS